MRIGFVSRRYFPAISGMSVYAQNLLRELVAAGDDVVMVSQYRGDDAGTAVYGGGPPPPVPGVEVVGLEALGEQDGGDFERDVERMVDALVAAHERAPFDVLHAQYGYPTGLAALEASRRLGVPNVVSIQGGDGHWVGSCCAVHREAMEVVLGHAGALLIGSRSFAGGVEARLGVPGPERWTIVPGAVDTTRFAVPDPEVRGPFAGRLLYHGRVDRRKGVLDFIDALALLRARGREVRATVSGIGPDLGAAFERAEELGFAVVDTAVAAASHVPVGVPAMADAAEVVFTGYADYDAAPGVYREQDVFVSPTYAEGFSNTILEAMASGLPVVAGRAVGVVDCIRDEENGLLVEPGDVEAQADALERLLDDEALRARLADAALGEAASVYSWTAVGAQIREVYRRLHGTAPDTSWALRAPHDPSCRFRAEPHLL